MLGRIVRSVFGPWSRPHARSRGMTLVEIMVVVVIISLVVGTVSVYVFGQLNEAQIKTARTQMSKIGESLDLYKLHHRSYPSTAEGLSALANPKGGGEPIMERVPADPWGSPYVYVYPGQHNPRKFDLMSYGPDQSAGGGDDVTNWDEPTK